MRKPAARASCSSPRHARLEHDVELYTMQRYLQHDTLENLGMSHFDAWAANFGETVTAMGVSSRKAQGIARVHDFLSFSTSRSL